MTIQSVTGTFTADEQASATFRPNTQLRRGRFNVAMWGAFDATVRMERSFDNGVTWIPESKPDLTYADFDAPQAFCVEENEEGVIYRLRCIEFASGEANYRISR